MRTESHQDEISLSQEGVATGGVLMPLTRRLGKGRKAVAVFMRAGGEGYHLEYGFWSIATGRVLNPDEEVAYRKCHFMEEHPGVTYGVKIDFARAIRTIAGRLNIGGKSAREILTQRRGGAEGTGGAESGPRMDTAYTRVMIAAVKRLVGMMDAIVVVADDLPDMAKTALAAAFEPGRVYAPPAMGLNRMIGV